MTLMIDVRVLLIKLWLFIALLLPCSAYVIGALYSSRKEVQHDLN